MSSNRAGLTNNKADIRDFFKSSEKKRKYEEENTLDISTQPNKKMSREPLFELQPTYEIPSPEKIENMPKLENSEICSKLEKLIKEDSDDSEIPDLDPQIEPIKPKLTKIGPKSKMSNCKKRKKFFSGIKIVHLLFQPFLSHGFFSLAIFH